MGNKIIEYLDLVLTLIQKQRTAVKAIRRSRTKRIGLFEIVLADEDKAGQIQKIQKQYEFQIGIIYNNLNAERERHGSEPLKNPFISK